MRGRETDPSHQGFSAALLLLICLLLARRERIRVAITDCFPLWLQTCPRHVCLTRRAPDPSVIPAPAGALPLHGEGGNQFANWLTDEVFPPQRNSPDSSFLHLRGRQPCPSHGPFTAAFNEDSVYKLAATFSVVAKISHPSPIRGSNRQVRGSRYPDREMVQPDWESPRISDGKPNKAGFHRKGRAAEGVSFPVATGKRMIRSM